MFEEVEEYFDPVQYKENGGYMALCPAHDDNNPSLSIDEGEDGKALIFCFAGCEYDEIIEAVMPKGCNGQSKNGNENANIQAKKPKKEKDLIAYEENYKERNWVTEYPYRDANGNIIYRVVRAKDRNGKKYFVPHVWNSEKKLWITGFNGVHKVPYRLNEVLQSQDKVFIVEGEKDADRCCDYGLTASTNPGGSNGWKPEFAQWFKDREIIVMPDQDEAGEKWLTKVCDSLSGVARSISILTLPSPHKDFSDWADAVESEGGEIMKEFTTLLETEALQEYEEEPVNEESNIPVVPLNNVFRLDAEIYTMVPQGGIPALLKLKWGDVGIPVEERNEFTRKLIQEKRAWNRTSFKIQHESCADITDTDWLFTPEGITVRHAPVKVDMKDNELVLEFLWVMANEDTEKFNFLLDWLAVYCFTNYRKLPSMILVGERGTGKNTLASFVRQFYQELAWSEKSFTGTYQYWASKKLLIIDEMDENRKQAYDTLKRLTGDELIQCNQKYMPAMMLRNNLNIIMTSNEIQPLHLERSELFCKPLNNQWFFHEIKLDPDNLPFNRDIKEQLRRRQGYFLRTELRERYEKWKTSDIPLKARYSICCPIIQEMKEQRANAGGKVDELAYNIISELIAEGKEYYDSTKISEEFLSSGMQQINTKTITNKLIKLKVVSPERESIRDGKHVKKVRKILPLNIEELDALFGIDE